MEWFTLNAKCKEAKKIHCEVECGSLSVLYNFASLSALFNPLTHVSEWIILLMPVGHLPKNKHLHLFLLNILDFRLLKKNALNATAFL